ncbi:MAG: MoxR family ATPase [Conexivisphaerales archaeon]
MNDIGEPINKAVRKILDQMSRAIVGKEEVIMKLLMCLLCEGHVLIEDYPGLGKTLIAKSFARTLGLQFKRIQFTSDLLPADITGSFFLDRNESRFVLRKGPLFANIVLADEVNRAPPRTQSALLEAMQERQVTIEDSTYQLPGPFMVIATQNPIEYEGTYPLPEAQVDRFLAKISVGYPSAQEEFSIAGKRNERKYDDVELEVVVDAPEVEEMRRGVEDVYVDKSLLNYMVEIVRRTRVHKDVEIGASPRGTLALLKLSKASAWMHGREYLIPDDIKQIALDALSHRIILKPEQMLRGGKSAAVVKEILEQVPVPKVD